MNEETFQKKQSEIFDKYEIPEEFHDWFANIAWEDCHSFGYEAVLDCLPQFIHRFMKPLKIFHERIAKNSHMAGYHQARSDTAWEFRMNKNIKEGDEAS